MKNLVSCITTFTWAGVHNPRRPFPPFSIFPRLNRFKMAYSKELQMEISKTKLKLEDEITQLLGKLRTIESELDKKQNALKQLNEDPEEYFRIEELIKTHFQ